MAERLSAAEEKKRRVIYGLVLIPVLFFLFVLVITGGISADYGLVLLFQMVAFLIGCWLAFQYPAIEKKYPALIGGVAGCFLGSCLFLVIWRPFPISAIELFIVTIVLCFGAHFLHKWWYSLDFVKQAEREKEEIKRKEAEALEDKKLDEPSNIARRIAEDIRKR